MTDEQIKKAITVAFYRGYESGYNDCAYVDAQEYDKVKSSDQLTKIIDEVVLWSKLSFSTS